MVLQQRKAGSGLIGGWTFGQRNALPSLYPLAYPFNSQKVAFVDLVGRNPTNTTLSDIWNANIVRTLPTVGFTVGVSSGSASDTAAGTGARTIEVDVIVATTYLAKTLTLTMNGQSKVTDASGTSVIRINAVRVKTAGSGGVNAGIIYAYDSTDTVTAGVPQTTTKIFGWMAVGTNNAEQAMYTVPDGYNAQINNILVGVSDAAVTARAGYVQLGYGIGGVVVPQILAGQINSGLGSGQVPFNNTGSAWIIPERADIRIQSALSGSGVVVCHVEMILYPTGE